MIHHAALKKLALVPSVIALVALLVALLTITPQASAQSNSNNKPTAESFCKQYTKTSENYACKDGWKGADCTDYLITHDEAHVTICQNSAREAAEVGSGGDTPDSMGEPEPEPTPTNNNSNNTEGLDTVRDVIDKMQKSQENATGEKPNKEAEELPDNVYGMYVNGKGQRQPLRVTKAPGEGNPAIIFFNGGGWHTDDQMGDKAAPLVVKRGYTAIVATYRLGSSGIYYQFEDVMRAIRHVRDNAAMYGVDPSRIAVWGDSAGGSLAMRAAGSGKSGAAAAVGWSAPTNAYTAIFKSPQSFAIGMDHSTCVPTDLNGLINTVDLLNGGSGDVMEHGGGLGNNNIDSIVSGDALGTVTEVLTLAQRAQQSGLNPASLSSGLEGGAGGEGQQGSGGNTEQSSRQLTSKKFLECLDNFNDASPALFASPLTPPTFLAGFDSDILIDPGQLYQMRDKLRSMGVPSSVVTLPGVVAPNTVPGENHLDYNEAFVGPTLDFLDKYLHPTNKSQ